jgi:hypothetical protein
LTTNSPAILTCEKLDDRKEGKDNPVGEPFLVVLLVQGLQRFDRTVGGIGKAVK